VHYRQDFLLQRVMWTKEVKRSSVRTKDETLTWLSIAPFVCVATNRRKLNKPPTFCSPPKAACDKQVGPRELFEGGSKSQKAYIRHLALHFHHVRWWRTVVQPTVPFGECEL
jgi:hypothetical protein